LIARKDALIRFKEHLWKLLEEKAEEYPAIDIEELKRRLYKPIVEHFEDLLEATPPEKITFDAMSIAEEIADLIDLKLDPEENVKTALDVMMKYFPVEAKREKKAKLAVSEWEAYLMSLPPEERARVRRIFEEELEKRIKAETFSLRGKLGWKTREIKSLEATLEEYKKRIEKIKRKLKFESQKASLEGLGNSILELARKLEEEIDRIYGEVNPVWHFRWGTEYIDRLRSKIKEVVTGFSQGKISYSKAKKELYELMSELLSKAKSEREKILKMLAEKYKPKPVEEVKPKPPVRRPAVTVPPCPMGEEPVALGALFKLVKMLTIEDVEKGAPYVTVVSSFYRSYRDVLRYVADVLGVDLSPEAYAAKAGRRMVKGIPVEELLRMHGLPNIDALVSVVDEIEKSIPATKLSNYFFCYQDGEIYGLEKRFARGKWEIRLKPVSKDFRREVKELIKPPEVAAPGVAVRRRYVRRYPEALIPIAPTIPKELEALAWRAAAEWCPGEPIERVQHGYVLILACMRSGRKVVADGYLWPTLREEAVFKLAPGEYYDPYEHRVVRKS